MVKILFRAPGCEKKVAETVDYEQKRIRANQVDKKYIKILIRSIICTYINIIFAIYIFSLATENTSVIINIIL